MAPTPPPVPPPPPVTVAVTIEPALQPAAETPAPSWLESLHIQGVSAGYRHDEEGGRGADGVAIHVLWGKPDSGLEIEWSPSFGHGSRGELDESYGHIQMALGVRYVANKQGTIRPFVVAAPMMSFLTLDAGMTSSTQSVAGAQAGLGVDLDVAHPGSVSFDVRAGRGIDIETRQLASWDVFATVSLGLYFPDR